MRGVLPPWYFSIWLVLNPHTDTLWWWWDNSTCVRVMSGAGIHGRATDLTFEFWIMDWKGQWKQTHQCPPEWINVYWQILVVASSALRSVHLLVVVCFVVLKQSSDYTEAMAAAVFFNRNSVVHYCRFITKTFNERLVTMWLLQGSDPHIWDNDHALVEKIIVKEMESSDFGDISYNSEIIIYCPSTKKCDAKPMYAR